MKSSKKTNLEQKLGISLFENCYKNWLSTCIFWYRHFPMSEINSESSFWRTSHLVFVLIFFWSAFSKSKKSQNVFWRGQGLFSPIQILIKQNSLECTLVFGLVGSTTSFSLRSITTHPPPNLVWCAPTTIAFFGTIIRSTA